MLLLQSLQKWYQNFTIHSLNEGLKIDHRYAQRNYWYGRVEGTPKVPKRGIRSKSHERNQKFWLFSHIFTNRFGHFSLA